jgi:hypothetical protein
MKNNIAELTDIDIDLNVLRAEWSKQVVYQSGYNWQSRNYVSFLFFTVYYQQLLLSIEDIIGEKPKNYIIQMHDPTLLSDKWYLNIAHKDVDRLTCITLPVYYNRMEPVNFYDNIEEDMPDKGDPIKVKPVQVGQYSEDHPTLVNVNNYHNVRVLDMSEPRIFIQMSYDITFNELLSKDINLRVI